MVPRSRDFLMTSAFFIIPANGSYLGHYKQIKLHIKSEVTILCYIHIIYSQNELFSSKYSEKQNFKIFEKNFFLKIFDCRGQNGRCRGPNGWGTLKYRSERVS